MIGPSAMAEEDIERVVAAEDAVARQMGDAAPSISRTTTSTVGFVADDRRSLAQLCNGARLGSGQRGVVEPDCHHTLGQSDGAPSPSPPTGERTARR